MKQTRHYTKEFKLKAIELSNQRDTLKQAADELDIRSDLLGRWRKEFYDNEQEAFRGSGHLSSVKNRKLSEIQQLKRELKEVKLERDILKKAINIFSKTGGLDIDL